MTAEFDATDMLGTVNRNPTQSSPSADSQLTLGRETIIFVLGGPGAGKGTLCAKLAKKYRWQHLSVGDILRAERENPKSEFADIIAHNMKHGTVGPMEITVQLLRRSINQAMEGDDANVFLLDGFPRKLDQLELFEKTVGPASSALFLNCSDRVRLLRLLDRGKNGDGSRQDDDMETIQKREDTFAKTSMTVIQHLEEASRVICIDAEQALEDVLVDVEHALRRVVQL